MKNPFKKESNTGLVVLLSVVVVGAGAAAYLYLTESGASTNKAVKHKLKDEAKNLAAGFISKKIGISKKTIKKLADHLVK
ncbi:hypothetical protein [Mucilaginibacter polytrichastri]|uniref:Uncharacterized protein n=1 Tax=Mucilaginibacter polytrichastri TaxID=1302689 RepID=A0A1Q5ZXJ6_9SPHI|nr:hypothetical protein [Mucilaginibacter polytrichastri]OKS86495.1 hypothetical protein RG47T_1951 [Mucilaginibacter polytrichastri]SFS78986.1 hypothetical protein SAMN04487890_10470 [Mucilaginibacter polytrichastri]